MLDALNLSMAELVALIGATAVAVPILVATVGRIISPLPSSLSEASKASRRR
jgi:hypothetical protein